MAQIFKKPTYSTSASSKKTAYINARLFDPESGLDEKGALLIDGNTIADLGAGLFNDGVPEGIEVIDCKNHLLTPGLIDIQVHFREPGQTHKEDMQSGSKSAVAGGITTVVCQPNTTPVIDNAELLKELAAKAKQESFCNIKFYPAITKSMHGKEITDMEAMAKLDNVAGFTDDGLPVMNAQIMRQAMEMSAKLGVPIAQHAEDLNLSSGGCINEGNVSRKLGVRAIPNISEAVIVARDVLIAAKTGGHYHVLHVSTKEALDAIRWGKSIGVNVTCEVAPHHFTLTDEAVLEHGTNAKMNPPLRSEEDRQALIEGLKDGTVDAIATDHAPHDAESKSKDLSDAPFGIVGVETMLPLSLELYHNNTLSLRDLLAKITYKPAGIIGHKGGRLQKNYPADLTLIDLGCEWEIDTAKFSGKSCNSPFNGKKVTGRAIMTVLGGNTVYFLD